MPKSEQQQVVMNYSPVLWEIANFADKNFEILQRSLSKEAESKRIIQDLSDEQFGKFDQMIKFLQKCLNINASDDVKLIHMMFVMKLLKYISIEMLDQNIVMAGFSAFSLESLVTKYINMLESILGKEDEFTQLIAILPKIKDANVANSNYLGTLALMTGSVAIDSLLFVFSETANSQANPLVDLHSKDESVRVHGSKEDAVAAKISSVSEKIKLIIKLVIKLERENDRSILFVLFIALPRFALKLSLQIKDFKEDFNKIYFLGKFLYPTNEANNLISSLRSSVTTESQELLDSLLGFVNKSAAEVPTSLSDLIFKFKRFVMNRPGLYSNPDLVRNLLDFGYELLKRYDYVRNIIDSSFFLPVEDHLKRFLFLLEADFQQQDNYYNQVVQHECYLLDLVNIIRIDNMPNDSTHYTLSELYSRVAEHENSYIKYSKYSFQKSDRENFILNLRSTAVSSKEIDCYLGKLKKLDQEEFYQLLYTRAETLRYRPNDLNDKVLDQFLCNIVCPNGFDFDVVKQWVIDKIEKGNLYECNSARSLIRAAFRIKLGVLDSRSIRFSGLARKTREFQLACETNISESRLNSEIVRVKGDLVRKNQAPVQVQGPSVYTYQNLNLGVAGLWGKFKDIIHYRKIFAGIKINDFIISFLGDYNSGKTLKDLYAVKYHNCLMCFAKNLDGAGFYNIADYVSCVEKQQKIKIVKQAISAEYRVNSISAEYRVNSISAEYRVNSIAKIIEEYISNMDRPSNVADTVLSDDMASLTSTNLISLTPMKQDGNTVINSKWWSILKQYQDIIIGLVGLLLAGSVFTIIGGWHVAIGLILVLQLLAWLVVKDKADFTIVGWLKALAYSSGYYMVVQYVLNLALIDSWACFLMIFILSVIGYVLADLAMRRLDIKYISFLLLSVIASVVLVYFPGLFGDYLVLAIVLSCSGAILLGGTDGPFTYKIMGVVFGVFLFTVAATLIYSLDITMTMLAQEQLVLLMFVILLICFQFGYFFKGEQANVKSAAYKLYFIILAEIVFLPLVFGLFTTELVGFYHWALVGIALLNLVLLLNKFLAITKTDPNNKLLIQVNSLITIGSIVAFGLHFDFSKIIALGIGPGIGGILAAIILPVILFLFINVIGKYGIKYAGVLVTGLLATVSCILALVAILVLAIVGLLLGLVLVSRDFLNNFFVTNYKFSRGIVLTKLNLIVTKLLTQVKTNLSDAAQYSEIKCLLTKDKVEYQDLVTAVDLIKAKLSAKRDNELTKYSLIIVLKYLQILIQEFDLHVFFTIVKHILILFSIVVKAGVSCLFNQDNQRFIDRLKAKLLTDYSNNLIISVYSIATNLSKNDIDHFGFIPLLLESLSVDISYFLFNPMVLKHLKTMFANNSNNTEITNDPLLTEIFAELEVLVNLQGCDLNNKWQALQRVNKFVDKFIVNAGVNNLLDKLYLFAKLLYPAQSANRLISSLKTVTSKESKDLLVELLAVKSPTDLGALIPRVIQLAGNSSGMYGNPDLVRNLLDFGYDLVKIYKYIVNAVNLPDDIKSPINLSLVDNLLNTMLALEKDFQRQGGYYNKNTNNADPDVLSDIMNITKIFNMPAGSSDYTLSELYELTQLHNHAYIEYSLFALQTSSRENFIYNLRSTTVTVEQIQKYVDRLNPEDKIEFYQLLYTRAESRRDKPIMWRSLKDGAVTGLDKYLSEVCPGNFNNIVTKIKNAVESVSELNCDSSRDLARAAFLVKLQKLSVNNINYIGKAKDACYVRDCHQNSLNDLAVSAQIKSCQGDIKYNTQGTVESKDQDLLVAKPSSISPELLTNLTVIIRSYEDLAKIDLSIFAKKFAADNRLGKTLQELYAVINLEQLNQMQVDGGEISFLQQLKGKLESAGFNYCSSYIQNLIDEEPYIYDLNEIVTALDGSDCSQIIASYLVDDSEKVIVPVSSWWDKLRGSESKLIGIVGFVAVAIIAGVVGGWHVAVGVILALQLLAWVAIAVKDKSDFKIVDWFKALAYVGGYYLTVQYSLSFISVNVAYILLALVVLTALAYILVKVISNKLDGKSLGFLIYNYIVSLSIVYMPNIFANELAFMVLLLIAVVWNLYWCHNNRARFKNFALGCSFVGIGFGLYKLGFINFGLLTQSQLLILVFMSLLAVNGLHYCFNHNINSIQISRKNWLIILLLEVFVLCLGELLLPIDLVIAKPQLINIIIISMMLVNLYGYLANIEVQDKPAWHNLAIVLACGGGLVAIVVIGLQFNLGSLLVGNISTLFMLVSLVVLMPLLLSYLIKNIVAITKAVIAVVLFIATGISAIISGLLSGFCGLNCIIAAKIHNTSKPSFDLVQRDASEFAKVMHDLGCNDKNIEKSLNR